MGQRTKERDWFFRVRKMFAGQQTVVDSFANALMELDAAPAQRALLEQGKVRGAPVNLAPGPSAFQT
jgi:hypothetical protein